MKLGIYARGLAGIGGVKQYIEAMCRAVIAILPPDDHLTIFHNLDAPYFGSTKPNVHEVSLSAKNRFKCDLIEAPKVINEHRLDVVWFTKYVVPFGVHAKTMTTVHDMAYYMPKLGAYAPADTLYMRVMIRNSCRRADRIIAVSHHTKKDIERILELPAEKITTIHEAADDRYHPATDASKLNKWRQQRNLEAPYILFTGGISPRKNLQRLIQAFALAALHIPHKLVLTGGKGWRNKDILQAIEHTPRVIRLGFVPDDEMPLLYSAADLFVYPSLYEGFGLPILEAQQCGCPVLSSNVASLPEVGGDGVHFIDPEDIDALSETIVTTLKNDILMASLKKRGFENAKRFSWQRAAEALLATARST